MLLGLLEKYFISSVLKVVNLQQSQNIIMRETIPCDVFVVQGKKLRSKIRVRLIDVGLIRLKKKNSVSQSCRPHLYFCAHLILQNTDFHFFFS